MIQFGFDLSEKTIQLLLRSSHGLSAARGSNPGQKKRSSLPASSAEDDTACWVSALDRTSCLSVAPPNWLTTSSTMSVSFRALHQRFRFSMQSNFLHVASMSRRAARCKSKPLKRRGFPLRQTRHENSRSLTGRIAKFPFIFKLMGRWNSDLSRRRPADFDSAIRRFISPPAVDFKREFGFQRLGEKCCVPTVYPQLLVDIHFARGGQGLIVACTGARSVRGFPPMAPHMVIILPHLTGGLPGSAIAGIAAAGRGIGRRRAVFPPDTLPPSAARRWRPTAGTGNEKSTPSRRQLAKPSASGGGFCAEPTPPSAPKSTSPVA